MKKNLPTYALPGLLLAWFLVAPVTARAADAMTASPTELRLRESLKTTMQQLADVQTQLQTAQQAQADSDKKITDLQGQLDALTKQARKDHQISDSTILALKQQLADAQRLVDDRERKNLELFHTANEILTRYEKFSLGDALGAKEPFTGNTRVKLENLVQDYQDKLIAQKARSTDGSSVAATAQPSDPLPSGTSLATNKSTNAKPATPVKP